MMKKKWKPPKLIIFSRGKDRQERVLGSCKCVGGPSVGTPFAVYFVCYTEPGCSSCLAYDAS